MLNFVHNIDNVKLVKMIDKYYKKLGRYFLLIDNIFVDSEEYSQ